MRPSLSGVTRAPACPRHTEPRTPPALIRPLPALAVTLLMATAGCSGSGGPGTAAPTVQIRLATAGAGANGANVEVGGLTAEDLDWLRAAELTNQEWADLLRVTVVQNEDVDEDTLLATPPVLGSYAIGDNDLLRFSPMFPFDLGRPYSVRFD
ncbi:MAG: hypothetical protein QF681_06340, partial [Vicinamibacterales bacterium]|nr:hypothetical protein [Vicinamibacterales bacterium]